MSEEKQNLVRVADSLFDRIQARRGLTAKNQSQLAKITILQDTQEEETPSREAYAKALNEFRDRVKNAILDLGDLSNGTQSSRIRRLTDMLDFLAKERKNKVPYGLGKYVRAAVNELVSLREAATLGDLTGDQITLRSTHGVITRVEELLEKEAVLAKTDKETDDVFEGDIENILSLASANTTLPVLGDNPFVIARVPIVPVPTTGILVAKKMAALGFDVSDAGGYAIMANQVVIGVSPKTPSDVHSALEQFQGERIVLVDARPQGKKGVLWYWVMRSEDLSRLAKAFSGNSLKLQSWGIAI